MRVADDLACPASAGGRYSVHAAVRALLGMCLLCVGLAFGPAAAVSASDVSAAERALFMAPHLSRLEPPLALRYVFRRSGSLEPAFADEVVVNLTASADGACCAVRPRFLTGVHAIEQPTLDNADGNPVILYFLERDVREMQRMTRGSAHYFRKRIRLAIQREAVLRESTLPYRGRPVAVQEIRVTPYRDDPYRSRYDALADKHYVFLMSPAVPGGLYGIRTRVDGPSADAPPRLLEEMLLEGAEAVPPGRQP